MIKQDIYIKRIIETKIQEKLRLSGAVVIEGPKWCGKTSCGKFFANTLFDLSDPSGNFSNRKSAILDPSSVLDGKKPRLIDEWQVAQGVWDAIKHAVDNSGKKGQYILTGSSTPNEDDENSRIHSGAGRMSKVRMRTMTLQEISKTKNLVKLNDLFNNIDVKITQGKLKLDQIIELSIIGGWPEHWANNTSCRDAYIRNKDYLDLIVGSNIKDKNGNAYRDPNKLKLLIKSISRNVATSVSLKTINLDVGEEQENKESISRPTILTYIDFLKRLFIIEEIPAWSTHIRSTVRLRKAPKIILADPSLVSASLEVLPESWKADLNAFGFVFESMVLKDLLVYAEVIDVSISHYRDNSDLEVDAILTKENNKWSAIEIKLGVDDVEEGASNLLRLKNKMIKEGKNEPSFLAVIVGVGGILQKRDDGVYIIPYDCLSV
ncbi:MAG: DUF4143 domain-containing protein [Mycoplasmataceae bacterium]|nr:DUF4143 domain-containing protein [Mycoplasmataceae bacterium]